MAKCSVEDCDRNSKVKGFCHRHYMKNRKYGDPTAGKYAPIRRGEVFRFLNGVVLNYDGDECLIWPYSTIRGYGQITINYKNQLVSRYVCAAKNGPPPSAIHEAAHSCGNGHRGCVSPRHLSWKTPKENALDKVTHGTVSSGERNGHAKLNKKKVLQIQDLLKAGLSQSVIARRFSVTSQTISKINVGSNWRCVHKEIDA